MLLKFIIVSSLAITRIVTSNFFVRSVKIETEIDYLETSQLILDEEESSHPEISLCKTRIITSDDNNFVVNVQRPSAKGIRTSVLLNDQKFIQNLTFFNREYSEADISFTSVWGSLRFSANCMVVLISSLEESGIRDLSTSLFSKKFARPHKDYFVFIAPRAAIDSFVRSDYYLKNIRFKSSISFEVNGGAPSIHNGCTSNPKTATLKISGRDCPDLLNAQHFHVSAVFGPQMCRFKNDENGKLISGDGIYFKMLEEGAKRFNFTFSIQTASHSGAALIKVNGTWLGAFGDVYNRKADLAVTVTISAARLQISDCSAPMNWLTRTFFIRAPSLKTNWEALFWALRPGVWISTGLTIVICTPFYYFFAKYQQYPRRVNYPTYRPTLGHVTFFLINIILDQSSRLKNWTGVKIRFLVTIWAYFALIIGTSYRSKLVSFLTFLEREQVPTTHRDLAFSNYKIFFRSYNGYAYRYTTESKDPVHIAISKRMVVHNTSTGCIIAATLTKKSACLDYGFSGVYAVSTNATLQSSGSANLNSFFKSNDVDIPIPMIWAFRKASPLTESFDKIILRSMCSGMHDRWVQDDFSKSQTIGAKWLKEQTVSKVRDKLTTIMIEQNSGPKSLTMKSLFGLFIVVSVGLVVSILAFTFESLQKFSRRMFKFLREIRKVSPIVLKSKTRVSPL